MSKFSLVVLQRRVFPFARADDPDILLGAAFGEDVSLTRVGDDVLVSHVDPIVGAIGDIGWLAVLVACNDIATTGIAPRWILLLILVPRMEDEELLEQIMRDASRAAGEIGVSIIGGHTGYSANLSRPLVAVTALGTASGREPVRTGGARVGDHVLVTKGVALEGTAILAQDFADVGLRLGLSHDLLRDPGGHRAAQADGGREPGFGGIRDGVRFRGPGRGRGRSARSRGWQDSSLHRDPLRGGRTGPYVGALPPGRVVQGR